MKTVITLALVCLAYATSFGQNVPQGIAYQAVAVKDGAYSVAGQNPQAIYWSNKEIKVRFTIFDTYPNGSSQYSEVHTTSTDEYGVFNLIIGQGSGLSGDFTTIPWELGDAHLQVEIDFENTNKYVLSVIEKFWSVPFALNSRSADTLLGVYKETDPIFNSSIAKGITSNDTTYWNNKLDSYTETDPIFNSSIAKGITSTDTTYWNNKPWLTEGDTTWTFNQVGIGTANPSSSLHINSTSSKTGLLIENTGTTSAKIVLNQAGSANGQAYYLVSRNDGNFVIGNASNGIADQFILDSLGNVGIRTKSTTHSLEVLGSGIGGSHALKLKRNRNKPNFGVRFDFNLLNSLNEDTKYGTIIGSIKDSAAGAEFGFLSFQVADGSGTWSDGYIQERLRIETDRVTVKNLMRLQSLSVPPASPLEVDIYMNRVSHKLMVYDGTTWQACW
jgi:hypothetical protein